MKQESNGFHSEKFLYFINWISLNWINFLHWRILVFLFFAELFHPVSLFKLKGVEIHQKKSKVHRTKKNELKQNVTASTATPRCKRRKIYHVLVSASRNNFK